MGRYSDRAAEALGGFPRGRLLSMRFGPGFILGGKPARVARRAPKRLPGRSLQEFQRTGLSLAPLQGDSERFQFRDIRDSFPRECDPH